MTYQNNNLNYTGDYFSSNTAYNQQYHPNNSAYDPSIHSPTYNYDLGNVASTSSASTSGTEDQEWDWNKDKSDMFLNQLHPWIAKIITGKHKHSFNYNIIV